MSKISESLEYRWPQEGDRLIPDASSEANSESFERSLDRHADIWSGYLSAGRELAKLLLRGHSTEAEMLYPLLFCYRHGIEMALKWLVARFGGRYGLKAKDTHNLWELWKDVATINCETGHSEGEVAAPEALIRELHELDRTSEAFRYAVNRRGELIQLPSSAIDLAHLKDVMDGLSHFFEGFRIELEELSAFNNEGY